MPYKKSEYKHYRQKSPDLFIKETYKTVSLSHTDYRGKKFAWFMKHGNALAVIGVLKTSRSKKGPRGGKVTTIQSILIPLDQVEKVK